MAGRLQPKRWVPAAALAVGVSVVAANLLGALASDGVSAKALKNNLIVSPAGSPGAATGSSISGGITFSAPAPGCTSGDSAVVTMKGPGAAAQPGGNADGSINITGAVAITPDSKISLDSGGSTWDGIAQANSIPRPLNGTYTVKAQCVDSGDQIESAFMDRDVTFVGSSQTWTAVGQAAGFPQCARQPRPAPLLPRLPRPPRTRR